MLKIEKLQPKDNAFTLEDHAEHGVATLVFDDATFKGEYHLHEVGTATVAGVGVAAKVGAQKTSLPSAIALTLTKKVTREYVLAEDQATIETGLTLPAANVANAVKVAGTTAATVNAVTVAGVVTLAGDVHKDETIKLEFNTLVAEGAAADDDVANAETLKLEPGETSAQDVHINILSNLRVNPGAKPNLTHFSVRGAKLHF